MELEKRIQGWEYWCPRCSNRTFGVIVETSDRLELENITGEKKYLMVRVLTCMRCSMPTVLGTHAYHNPKDGWGARGSLSNPMVWHEMGQGGGAIPYEYLAFQEPGSEKPLPASMPKKVKSSYREAEFAVAHAKPISAASAIRNTIRLLVESEGIEESELKSAIKQLDIAEGYRKAIGDLKLIGDHTLHYEEYEIAELSNALEVLHLALSEMYRSRERLKELTKAVGDKASQHGKSATS